MSNKTSKQCKACAFITNASQIILWSTLTVFSALFSVGLAYIAGKSIIGAVTGDKESIIILAVIVVSACVVWYMTCCTSYATDSEDDVKDREK